MSREIRFSVDDEDYPGIVEYAKRKGHRTPANLARFAVYALMARNPVGRHDKLGAVRTEVTGGDSKEGIGG
jgi:hypothetical protein